MLTNQVIDCYVDRRHENGEKTIKRDVCFCYNIVTTQKKRRITQQAYTLLMYYTYNTDTASNAENAEAVQLLKMMTRMETICVV